MFQYEALLLDCISSKVGRYLANIIRDLSFVSTKHYQSPSSRIIKSIIHTSQIYNICGVFRKPTINPCFNGLNIASMSSRMATTYTDYDYMSVYGTQSRCWGDLDLKV